MSDDLRRQLLGAEGDDPGCEVCFEVFELWGEAVLAGRDVERLFPQVTAHLLSCAACREDAEGLLAALRGGDDASAPR